MSPRIRILVSHNEVADFLGHVIEAADCNKSALGFFPESVFFEYARQRSLYVAVQACNGDEVFAGYLLFDCRYPKAKVLQIYAAPNFRKAGIARALINHLKEELTKHGFISISARVAEDLTEANQFWSKQDFYIQRVTPGGRTTNRTILTRTHELKSPQLFELSGITSSNPLELEQFGSIEPPLFLLDLNVLYDLNPNRPRSNLSVSLFRAERMGVCRLAISSEIDAELRRTAEAGKPDPMLSFVQIFPVFSLSSTKNIKDLIEELASVVFPAKIWSDLTPNERSDLRHVATAIQHQLAGLVTNDRAVLNAAGYVKAKYGVQICSPAVFEQITSTVLENNSFALSSLKTIELRQVKDGDLQSVQELLLRIGIPSSEISSGWGALATPLNIATRLGVWDESSLHGYLTCHTSANESVIAARIAIDESQPNPDKSARLLLGTLINYASDTDLNKIRLNIGAKQDSVRAQALMLGFSWSERELSLNKIVISKPLTVASWTGIRKEIQLLGGVTLPALPPPYVHNSQHIEIHTNNGNKAFITLNALETLLSPALFFLTGRPALITP